MNIVFFGTSEFAIPAMKGLLESPHKVVAVVTQPDRKKGRSLKLSPPPTKVLALSEGLPVYQPADASGRESIEYLKKLNADVFVVISFGQILKKEVLSVPKLYSINVHGSLLPKYRGAAPTNWAIINGDKSTGLTIIKMNERMDGGDIILKKETGIDKDDTNITLSEKMSSLGAEVLLGAMDIIESNKVSFQRQDDSLATYAPKLKKEDGLIDWDEDAIKIHNKVRGYIPWPGAYTHLDGKILKIWKTQISDLPSEGNIKSGTVLGVIENKGIIMKTGSKGLAITHLQIEGKKILDSDSFVRGHRITKGDRFG